MVGLDLVIQTVIEDSVDCYHCTWASIGDHVRCLMKRHPNGSRKEASLKSNFERELKIDD